MLLVYRDAHTMLILNRYPYIGGHLLVAPLRHTNDLAGLKPAESKSLWNLTQRGLGALQKIYEPQGANVGMNLGKAGGAAVEGHLHMHIVPRWLGDTNFMFVSGGTHMVHGDLEELWAALRQEFKLPVL
jgi:ATP adenylyltransferase